MFEFLQTEFYGNTIYSWFFALGLMLTCIVFGRIAYWFLGKYIDRLNQKGHTRWDLLLVQSLRLPVTMGLILLGIRLCINILTLNNTFELWIGRIYHILIVVNVSWVVARINDSLFQEFIIPVAAKTSTDLSEMIVPFFQKGTRLLIWSLGLIIGLNNAGYDVGALIAGLGIGGVAVALAARNTISNVFGGITVFLDQPFKIGDKIKVKSRIRGIEGKVKEVGLRITSLETSEGTVIMVPNAIFATDPVENLSREPSRKVSGFLHFSKKNSSSRITEFLTQAQKIIDKDPDTVPPASVVLCNIGSDSLEIGFTYYIQKEKEYGEVQTRINLLVLQEIENKKFLWAEPATPKSLSDDD